MPDSVFYCMMEAVPNKDNVADRDCGGALINCWVKAENEDAARIIARQYVKDENWIFVKEEEASRAERRFYTDEPVAMACSDEACEYGLSAVFYMWPLDDEKPNERVNHF